MQDSHLKASSFLPIHVLFLLLKLIELLKVKIPGKLTPMQNSWRTISVLNSINSICLMGHTVFLFCLFVFCLCFWNLLCWVGQFAPSVILLMNLTHWQKQGLAGEKTYTTCHKCWLKGTGRFPTVFWSFSNAVKVFSIQSSMNKGCLRTFSEDIQSAQTMF